MSPSWPSRASSTLKLAHPTMPAQRCGRIDHTTDVLIYGHWAVSFMRPAPSNRKSTYHITTIVPFDPRTWMVSTRQSWRDNTHPSPEPTLKNLPPSSRWCCKSIPTIDPIVISCSSYPSCRHNFTPITITLLGPNRSNLNCCCRPSSGPPPPPPRPRRRVFTNTNLNSLTSNYPNPTTTHKNSSNNPTPITSNELVTHQAPKSSHKMCKARSARSTSQHRPFKI